MKSNIYNRQGERVEQLVENGIIILDLQNSAGNLLIADGGATIALDTNRTYEINKIRIGLLYFNNADTGLYAFPKFEQFGLGLNLKARIVYSVDLSEQELLFQNLISGSFDGSSIEIIFDEPFIFTTDSIQKDLLSITITNGGSMFVNLTGIPVPPVVGQTIELKGFISLEGKSYLAISPDQRGSNNSQEIIYETPELDL